MVWETSSVFNWAISYVWLWSQTNCESLFQLPISVILRTSLSWTHLPTCLFFVTLVRGWQTDWTWDTFSRKTMKLLTFLPVPCGETLFLNPQTSKSVFWMGTGRNSSGFLKLGWALVEHRKNEGWTGYHRECSAWSDVRNKKFSVYDSQLIYASEVYLQVSPWASITFAPSY